MKSKLRITYSLIFLTKNRILRISNKRIFFLAATIINCFTGNAQGLCNLAGTQIPSNTFYSNSTNNFSSLNNYTLFLCGPSTIVYDTINEFVCKTALVNSNSKLIISGTCTLSTNIIWVKNGGTLILQKGNPNTFAVYYEPGAIIIDLIGGVTKTSCSLITFPTVNCVAGITEYSKANDIFALYPNPCSAKIIIELKDLNIQYFDLIIRNQLDEVVYLIRPETLKHLEIATDFLANGLYFVQVKTKLGTHIEKILIIH